MEKGKGRKMEIFGEGRVIMKIKKIQGIDRDTLIGALKNTFHDLEYDAYIAPEDHGIDVSHIRLSKGFVEKYGYNVNQSHRRGNILGWSDWVRVNNAVNDVLDRLRVSARVFSQKGLFKIREGSKRFTEADWEALGQRNVGSMMSPVEQREAWQPEDERKRAKLRMVI